jgi:hypothetical protein
MTRHLGHLDPGLGRHVRARTSASASGRGLLQAGRGLQRQRQGADSFRQGADGKWWILLMCSPIYIYIYINLFFEQMGDPTALKRTSNCNIFYMIALTNVSNMPIKYKNTEKKY